MATFLITGVGPGLPVEDMLAHPGGADAASTLTQVRALFPGQGLSLISSAPFGTARAGRDEILVGVFGGTTLMFGVGAGSVVAPSGAGVYGFSYQSLMDAYEFEVVTADQRRRIQLCRGRIEQAEGAPLPFELPFWAGAGAQVQGGQYDFDDSSWASAGMRWAFGYHASGPPSSEDRLNLRGTMMHVVAFADEDPGAALARRLGL